MPIFISRWCHFKSLESSYEEVFPLPVRLRLLVVSFKVSAFISQYKQSKERRKATTKIELLKFLYGVKRLSYKILLLVCQPGRLLGLQFSSLSICFEVTDLMYILTVPVSDVFFFICVEEKFGSLVVYAEKLQVRYYRVFPEVRLDKS